MKRLLLFAAVIILSFLTGCVRHYAVYSTDNISKKLDIDDLYKIYNVKPVDLSSYSKCERPPAIKIVNAESRVKEYVIFRDQLHEGATSITYLINPSKMMDSVAKYLESGFKRSQIKVDNKSTKILELKMIDMSLTGRLSFGSYCKIELLIPETGYTKLYEATDNSMEGFIAAAYPIHTITRQIINDSTIQDYILCKNEYKAPIKEQKEGNGTSKSLSQRLQELQITFDSGLITKEEYQAKRKAILEKF